MVNVKHIARYTAKIKAEDETMVEKVISHKLTRRGYRFKVKWGDGDTTEVPMDNFVDVTDGGEKRWNEQLKEYARTHGIPLQA